MSAPSMQGLAVKDLAAGYGRAPVISGICVEAEPGALIALIGPNGSGKSTLIKTLTGLLPISAGEIWAGDTPLNYLEPRERAKSIAYLAQERTALPSMTTTEILELGRAPYRGRLGRISEQGHAAIDRAVEATDLQEYLTRPFGELSGGEQARVLLARALVVDAPIILADEPNAALDPYYQISTMKILKAEAARGKTVIAALHDLRLAKRFANQVWVLDKGKVAAQGATQKIMTEEIVFKVFRIESSR